MNEALERDLELWASGMLSLDALEWRHPEAGVRELARLHRRLEDAGRVQAPDPIAGWEHLRAHLDDHPVLPMPAAGNGAGRDTTPATIKATTPFQAPGLDAPSGPSPVRRIRRLVAVGAVAAALLAMTAIAYAAGPQQVRRGFDRFVDIVQQVTPFRDQKATPSPALTEADDIGRRPRGTDGTSRSGGGGSTGGGTSDTRSDDAPAAGGGTTTTSTPSPQGTFQPQDGSFTYGTPPPYPSSWPTPGSYPTPPPYPTRPPQPTPTPTPEPTQTASPQEQTAEPSTADEPSPEP